MPKRKGKGAKKSDSSNVSNTRRDVGADGLSFENASINHEVERQSAAIRTISEVEIERLLTALRLLTSNISKEQIQTPLLQYFEENLQHLMVSRTQKDGLIEVKWKDKDGELSMNTADGGHMMSSFLQHMSMASETHILRTEESMQTPGVTSQRLSVGMTPKTLRLPKQGEMLLSVHGSPLGVYNMDAIHETEEE